MKTDLSHTILSLLRVLLPKIWYNSLRRCRCDWCLHTTQETCIGEIGYLLYMYMNNTTTSTWGRWSRLSQGEFNLIVQLVVGVVCPVIICAHQSLLSVLYSSRSNFIRIFSFGFFLLYSKHRHISQIINYLRGMNLELCVAPIPGRPCFTGLYVMLNSPR